MTRKYSVFLGNVGSCSDRYCAAYGKPYTVRELFQRAATVPHLTGVDLVLTPDLIAEFSTVREMLKETGLKPVSLAVDHFAQAKWKQGSFSAPDAAGRRSAVDDTKRAADRKLRFRRSSRLGHCRRIPETKQGRYRIPCEVETPLLKNSIRALLFLFFPVIPRGNSPVVVKTA